VTTLTIKVVSTNIELQQVIAIRTKVFVEEQYVPYELEVDGLDETAEHIIAHHKNKPIGCARIRIVENYAKLERLAVLKEYRGQSIGQQLTRFAITYCKTKPVTEMHLHAQLPVAGFYETLGFKRYGKEFDEAGIKHIAMCIPLKE